MILAAAAMLAAGCDQPGKEPQAATARQETPVIKVSVVKVEPSLLRDVLILPGSLKPWQDIRVSAGIGGRVEWLGVKEGQAVNKGDLIAKVNVSALKASLDSAQAAFDLADKTLQRIKSLYESKIVTRETLEQAETQQAAALGVLNQIKAQYKEGFVYAPISGYVNQLYIDQGEFTGPGSPLLDLVDVSQMKIDVSVPELDVRFLKIGQKCLVTVDAFQGRPPMPGTIIFVAYQADAVTKTFRVTVTIKNTGQDLRAGMIARLAFLRREVPDALAVPLSAVVNKGGERVLFVEENGITRARKIEFGILEKDRVQITKGLSAGENIIVEGQASLEEGVEVQVR